MPGQIASSYKVKRPGTFIFTNPGISSLLSLISDNKDNTSTETSDSQFKALSIIYFSNT